VFGGFYTRINQFHNMRSGIAVFAVVWADSSRRKRCAKFSLKHQLCFYLTATQSDVIFCRV
jgi:hypothetical protein